MTAATKRKRRPPQLFTVRFRPHVVYIHRDANGQALYVGCCARVNFSERTGAHRRGAAHWWPLVAAVVVESEHPTFAAGRLREAELIEQLQPPNNIYHPPVAQWRAKRLSEIADLVSV